MSWSSLALLSLRGDVGGADEHHSLRLRRIRQDVDLQLGEDGKGVCVFPWIKLRQMVMTLKSEDEQILKH